MPRPLRIEYPVVRDAMLCAVGIEVRYEAGMTSFEKLSQSILAKAFRGGRVPQDPNDEPAFLCWLSLKEAYAIENDLQEALAVTRDAMAEFLLDHLARWAGSFSNRLLHTIGNPLYVTASHLLLATVSFAADEPEWKKSGTDWNRLVLQVYVGSSRQTDRFP